MTAGNRPAVPPARHPDLDTLADLDAGLLDAPAAERLTAHVAGCARCTPVPWPRWAPSAPTWPRCPPRRCRTRSPPGSTRPSPGSAATTTGSRGPAPPPRAASRTPPPIPRVRLGPTRRRARFGGRGGPGRGPTAAPAAFAAARRRGRRRRLRVAGRRRLRHRAGPHRGHRRGQCRRWRRRRARVRVGRAGAGRRGPCRGRRGRAATAPRDASIPSYTRETLRRDLATIERDATLGAGAGRASSGPAGAMADPDRRRACERSIIGREGVLRAVLRIRYDGQPAYAFVFDDGRRQTRVRGRRPVRHRRAVAGARPGVLTPAR